MKVTDIPVISHVFESGAEDRMFDSLLLAGPFLIFLIATLGRTLITEVISILYITLFIGHVLYRGIT